MSCALTSCTVQRGGTDCQEGGEATDIKLPTTASLLPIWPGSPHPCPVLPTDQVAPKAYSRCVLPSTALSSSQTHLL